MSAHKFWKGLTPLNISSAHQLIPEKIVKICSLGDEFLVLSENHSLYLCSIEEELVKFKKVEGFSPVDISFHKDVLYLIDVNGCIIRTNVHFDQREEVVVNQDAKFCRHGVQSSSYKVKFRNIVTSDFGQLLISSNGQLWGSGNMPHISIDTDSIKKVPFFEGRTVFSAALGENFATVIARKKVRQCNCDTDSDNDDDKVFAASCTQCQGMVLALRPSVQTVSETCPLGVQLSNSKEKSSPSIPKNEVHLNEGSISDDSSHSDDETKIMTPTTVDKDNLSELNNSESSNLDGESSSIQESCDVDSIQENCDENVDKSGRPLNNIFINKDAARQFLSKQLSWVSAGEDYLVEYTEKPTRIIKKNISNLTSLVYEGVKTVGDKVANLSRHVSGSSDHNEAETEHDQCGQQSSLMFHCSSSCHLNDLHISTSTISSEKEFECNRKQENIKNLSKLGKHILSTELWTWGDISHGQLGIGDTIKRIKPVQVMTLTGCGLQKVSCGKWHGSVLTLDGRLLLWGDNNYHQVCFDSRDVKSGPKQFAENSDDDRVRDMIATDHHTLVYTQNENIFYMGKHSKGFTDSIVNLNKKVQAEENKVTKNDIALVKISKKTSKNKAQSICHHWKVLSSGDISYCSLEETASSPEFHNLSLAQKYLEEMILIHQSLIKPFFKKSKSITSHSNIYETVCDLFNDILNLTALTVLSMWQLAEKHILECDITLIKHCEEIIYLYKKYYLALCDIIVIGGFATINNVIDVPSSVYNLFSDQLASNKQKMNKKSLEAIVGLALTQPLTRLSTYKCIIQSIIRQKPNRKHDTKNYTDDRLNKVLTALESLIEEQEKVRKEAMVTKLFWETTGKTLEQYKTPERRLIRESKSRPISLANPGIFSSHWFVLFNNIFIHIFGTYPTVHPLETVWVEPVTNAEPQQHLLQIITPEETLLLSATSDQEKSEWLQAFNSAIKAILKKETLFKPPALRAASYSYSDKSGFFKEAKYIGRWKDGKLHGHGKVEWPDGKVFAGQFELNTLCGYGKMEIPGVGVYEGQWKENLFNGYGVMKYTNGDIYEGFFKDGQCHGHGIKRRGDFTSSTATIYTGNWANGVKQGYGVMDDIGKGEKYLGNWSDNKKHGCGLIVTLDGIYYEGLFMQDVLTGHGVMVFEDGTHYEGEFRSAGVFCGKGTLTFCSGDKIEGSLNGAWTEGVKIANATLHLNVSNPLPSENSKPNSFGKLCVAPNQKWNGLFRQCFQRLGIPETSLSPTGHHFSNGIDNKKIWQNVAVAISCSHNVKHNKSPSKLTKGTMGKVVEQTVDVLEVIPRFGQQLMTLEDCAELKQYLQSACESAHHPLGHLVMGLTNAFNTTYGGVRVHPLLLSHAVKELKSITSRLYQVVRLLFPALPTEGADVVLPLNKDCDEGSDANPVDSEAVSTASLLQPTLLPRVHPALFVLYALHNKREDDLYWRRLLKWNKQPDITLMAFLGIDPKFWIGYSNPTNQQLSPAHAPRHQIFNDAVETLQQLKTTFSPVEKLLVIRSTFQTMTVAVQKELGDNYLWTMDELFPVFHFVVVRAQILQLGSEIHFIDDFLDPHMQHGELGLMFTTLKACYFQILQEKMTIN